MLFSSFSFLFIFLPLLLVLYFVIKPEYRNILLLIASLVFYGVGEITFLYLLLSVVIINYISAIAMVNYNKLKKIIFIFTLITNVGMLMYFKYFNFIVHTYANIRHSNINFVEIALPLGISFYIFQALSYIIDVYKNNIEPQKNIYKFALYICMFPQLVAGPIIKYRDICEQLNPEKRIIDFDNLCIGTKRFIIGLGKKVLIANNIGYIADKIFGQSPDMFTHSIAWLGAVAYTLQLFFDFSGYSDMAIGLGKIFGFKFMENFNYPFISRSVTEFWRRWHISLSTWFKEYVYINLGGNRYGLTRTIFNLGVVFLLTGIWHGANWTFILWGIWHGLFIIAEKIINIKNFENKFNSLPIKCLQHLYLIFVVVCGFVVFRSDNLTYAWNYFKNMFWLTENSAEKYTYDLYYYIDNMDLIVLVIAILISIPLFKNMIYTKNNISKIAVNVWLLIIFVLSVISIAANNYNPFIYFRF